MSLVFFNWNYSATVAFNITDQCQNTDFLIMIEVHAPFGEMIHKKKNHKSVGKKD